MIFAPPLSTSSSPLDPYSWTDSWGWWRLDGEALTLRPYLGEWRWLRWPELELDGKQVRFCSNPQQDSLPPSVLLPILGELHVIILGGFYWPTSISLYDDDDDLGIFLRSTCVSQSLFSKIHSWIGMSNHLNFFFATLAERGFLIFYFDWFILDFYPFF